MNLNRKNITDTLVSTFRNGTIRRYATQNRIVILASATQIDRPFTANCRCSQFAWKISKLPGNAYSANGSKRS